ncbi:hypothetical protein PG984_002781 [Apiospora sp. TS-2023a]
MAPPVVSPLAKSTIRDACKTLEATIATGDLQAMKEMKTIEQVREEVLKIECQLASRQKLRNLRRLLPLFQGMGHYAKVVDILCNGTPFLPWVWAPITLILRVSSEHLEAFDQILSSYAEIADSLKRFGVLDKRFSQNQDFQETAAVFYADIVEFHKHAYKFVTSNSWKLLFQTSWHNFQRRFDSIISDLKRHEALVDKLAQAIHISEGQEMREDNDKMLKEIRRWREESSEKLKRSEEEQGAKQFNSIVAWLKVDESDQVAIFDLLLEESTRYNVDTCGWVLKNPKMQSALQHRPNVPLLWVQGAAGTGKSVLSASIVNFMRRAKSLVISHFSNHAYPSSTKYDTILRSLLLQLVRKDGDLVAHVYENYILAKKVASAPLMERLLTFLLANIGKVPQQTSYVWIVLDGVDECDPMTQNKLFRLVSQVTARDFSPNTMIGKALISCRFSAAASAKLSKKQSISLAEEKEHMNRAIWNYTCGRFKQDICVKFNEMHLTDGDVEEVENAITEKADGMFLYARLVLDYLSSNIFYEPHEIKTSVYKLPAKLSEFYSKILTQILVRLDSTSVNRVKCALGWIAFSKRPMQKIELQSALAFSLGDAGIKNIAPQDLLDRCATLIEERPDSRVGFVHVSLKEFLESSSSNLVLVERECLLQHGIAAVTCLLAGIESFPDSVPDDRVLVRIIRGLHGFHIYAKEHWADYLLSLTPSNENPGSPDSTLFDMACDLANKLNELSTNPGHLPDRMDDLLVEEDQTPKKTADDRIGSLSSPLLQHVIDGCLKARSLEQLELKLKQMESRGQPIDDTAPSTIPPPQEGVSIILQRYQTAVRYLLDQPDFPGIAAAELDFFKRQFGASAYTCRVHRCPRAISGFQHQAQCSEHEILHVRNLPCHYPGCQSPAFMSSKALKRHIEKEHAKPAHPKTIRKVGNLPPREGFEYQAPRHSGFASVSLPTKNNNDTEQPIESHVNEAELEALMLVVATLPPTVIGLPPRRVSEKLPVLKRSQLKHLGPEWRFVYEKYLIQNLVEGERVQLEEMFLQASLQPDPMNTLPIIFSSTLKALDSNSAAKFRSLLLSMTMDSVDLTKFGKLMRVMGLGPNEGDIYAGSPVPQLTTIPGPSSSNYNMEQHRNVSLYSTTSPMALRNSNQGPTQGSAVLGRIVKDAIGELPQDIAMVATQIATQRSWNLVHRQKRRDSPRIFKEIIEEAKHEALKVAAQELDYNSVPDSIKAHVEDFDFHPPLNLDTDGRNRFIEAQRLAYTYALVSMEKATKKAQEIETALKENSAGNPWAAGFDLKQMLDEKRESELTHNYYSQILHEIRAKQEGLKSHYIEWINSLQGTSS